MNTSAITRVGNRALWKIKKNAPQILFVTGIVGSVATVALASRAGAKSVPVLEKLADDRAELEEFRANNEVTDKDYETIVRDQYGHVGYDLVRLYGPVAVVGVVSLVALTKSHVMLTNRNAALTVALGSLDRVFKEYRARVRSELGDEQDQEFLHGTVDQEIESTNSKGVTKTKTIKVLDPEGSTPYSYYFDLQNPCWDKDPGYNHTFLASQQKWANLELQRRGHLFLNEVFDLIKIPHTQVGQIVGWVYDRDNVDGDGYVDFGFNSNGEFVAGYVNDVWLDFNVDGPILEKI